MLGICQGAQKITLELGGAVLRPGEDFEAGSHEYGYYCIEPTEDEHSFLDKPLVVTQAHCHSFTIPSGAKHLPKSVRFPNQAFQFGEHVFGMQFHPEVTIKIFRRWQHMLTLYDKMPGAQRPEVQTKLKYEHDARQALWFYSFLARLFGFPE